MILLLGKINKLEPISIRVDHQEPDIKNFSNLKENDLESIDLIKNVKTYVSSLDIENKKDVVSYVEDIYNNLIKWKQK